MVKTKEEAEMIEDAKNFGADFAWMLAHAIDKMAPQKKKRWFGTYKVFELPFEQVRRIYFENLKKEGGDLL
jgi:hypothetical protein